MLGLILVSPRRRARNPIKGMKPFHEMGQQEMVPVLKI
jgi:hypothetical protein